MKANSQEKTKVTSKKEPLYTFAVGRRKTAIARVRLFHKDKKTDNIDIVVNDMPVGQYFQDQSSRMTYAKPLEITDTLSKYRVTAKIEGSGLVSQLQALIHGISRALVKAESAYKEPLKKASLLTRDPRKRQMRMIGTGGKSRRKKQSPKR